MGGQYAIRGYILQTVIAIFDVLNDELDWEFIQVEPKLDSKKVDILWYYKNGEIKAIQVKSSKNQITKPQAIKWAKELQQTFQANSYVLTLLGPSSQATIDLESVGLVMIPLPLSIDIDGWIAQLAHKLDFYMYKKGIGDLPPDVQEIIVKALVTQFEIYSTKSAKVSKHDFEGMLSKWIKTLLNTSKGVTTSVYNEVKNATIDILKQWKKQHNYTDNFIELELSEKPEKSGYKHKRFNKTDICKLLQNAQQMMLKGLPGAGKTIMLIQIADFLLNQEDGPLPLLISLPEWSEAGEDLLSFVETLLEFRAKNIKATEIAYLVNDKRLVFLLNGWNEIPESRIDRARLRFNPSIGASGVIVTTRERQVLPPLHNPVVLYVNPMSRLQRREMIEKTSIGNKAELIRQIEYNPNLDEITRAPLFLSAILEIAQKDIKLPTTRYGIFYNLVSAIEEKEEHKNALQRPPLTGNHYEYLKEIAVAMTLNGGASINKKKVLEVLTKTSKARMTKGEITQLPESESILDVLCDHHLLVKPEPSINMIRFVHQQFQEWFAAGNLYNLLSELVKNQNSDEIFEFKKKIINQPIWEEALLFLAEHIAEQSPYNKEEAQNGTNLIRWTIDVDPIFSAQIANNFRENVWKDVSELFNELFRNWYGFKEKTHKEYALSGMLSTGKPDFKDLIWPLLESKDQQVRLSTYRIVEPMPLSCLGLDWQSKVKMWDEERRSEFIQEISWNANAESISLAEKSSKNRRKSKSTYCSNGCFGVEWRFRYSNQYIREI